MGSLFFLIYIKNLITDLLSTTKVFAEDTSISSVVKNTNESADRVNKDSRKKLCGINGEFLSILTFLNKLKKLFSLEKVRTIFHFPEFFNNSRVVSTFNQKHSGVFLDKKLNFNEHIKEKIAEASNIIL